LSTSTINSYTVKYTLSDGTFSTQTLGITAASFSSSKSMSYDGVDDYILAPIPLEAFNVATIRSFSFWVKINTLNVNTPFFGDTGSTAALFRRANNCGVHSGRIRWALEGLSTTSGCFIATEKVDGTGTAPNIGDGNWHHVAVYNAVDNSSNRANIVDCKIWLDGNELTNDTENAGTASVRGFTGGELALGAGLSNGSSGQIYLDGNIDEFAYFTNYQLTDLDVSTIYNSGVPNNLDDLSTPPTAWYRMGENGSWKSPQWLLLENSNVDNSRISNYSLQFDGVDDEILTSSNFVATGEFTISVWVKPTIFNSNQNIVGFGPSGSNWINPNSATNVRVRTSSALLNFPETGGNNLVLNAWNHILVYRDSSDNIGVFVNGATFGATLNNTGSLSLSTIGRGTSKRFAGNLDEIAFWNTNKSSDISSIYSGGTPSDLSSLSPVAYYKMGEEATFVYNVDPEGTWTIPDQAGSSDGTSNNTFLDTGRVGDAPNSTSNAVSFNMLETDRKEDTPPTP